MEYMQHIVTKIATGKMIAIFNSREEADLFMDQKENTHKLFINKKILHKNVSLESNKETQFLNGLDLFRKNKLLEVAE